MNKTLFNTACIILTTYVLYCVSLLIWVVIYSGSGDGDTLEHVHTSWLVSTGKIPYKDFFQHHNPLLWYIGAPVVHLFEYSLRAIDAANFIAITSTAIMMYYAYKINRDFLSNKLGGLIAASFAAFGHDSLYEKDFKPDNFMAMSIVVSLYYLFKYMKNKKLSDLVLSFLSLFASFMFTQKAALFLVLVGIYLVYLIAVKEIELKDCISAAILPCTIYLTFLAFLYYHDVLLMYFKANFELNSHIPDVFYTRRYISPCLELILPLMLSIYALVAYVYKGDIYIKSMGYFFIIEYVIRFYYFTPFVYYFALMQALASILAGAAVAKIVENHKYILYLTLAYFIGVGTIYGITYSKRITVGDEYKYGATGYVLSLTNPCDYIVNGYRIGYNIFGKDIDYIWNLLGQIDVIAETIGIRKTADLEGLIRKYRPKIISGTNYYDTYRAYRGAINVYPIHMISQDMLNEMYTPLNRDDIYILKPEYQSYDCRYNPRTKTYEYYDFK